MLGTARCLSWSRVNLSLCSPTQVNYARGSTIGLGLICLATHNVQLKPCAVRRLPRSGRALVRDNFSCRHVHCQHRADLAASLDGTDKPSFDKHDAVVVLGGGLTPDGGIPAWGQQRLQTALAIHKQTSEVTQTRSAGHMLMQHEPAFQHIQYMQQTCSAGHVIHESSAYTSYLHKHGIPAKHLLKEVSSYDTVGNAYFCLVIHALPAGWRRLAVVTSDFHMPRTEAIFRHCAKLASAERDSKDGFELSFHSASDADIFPADILQARKEREAESLQTWYMNSQKLDTLQQLHCFIHQEHACYSVAHQAVFGQPELDDVNDQALASY
ncbi:hypothetical protein ABBQ38_001533 [Trebouxia sp. C0009 RCD-2024]